MSRSPRVCAALVLSVALALVPAWAEAKVTTTRAGLILDDAHVLDRAQVVRGINALRNDAKVRVAVLTTDDPAVGKDTYDEDVLAYLQEHHADVTDDGSGELPDDLVVVAVSPDIRQVGVYAGADVVLDEGDVADVVDAMRADARAKRWDDAVVEGAKKALAITSAAATDPDPTGTGGGTGTDEPDDPMYPVPADPTSGASGVRLAPVVGGVAGVLALIGGTVGAVAVTRRRRERRRWLAWTPEPTTVAAALTSWKSTAEQVQTVGYPAPPLDPDGNRVDPAAAIDTLEALSSTGPTAGQRTDPATRDRLLALLEPQALLAGWLADATFWAREPGWEGRWSRELLRWVTQPLAALEGSLDDLAEHVDADDVADVRARTAPLAAAADQLDADVRSGALRPTDGVAQARTLNQQIREFAEAEAGSLGRGLSASAGRRLARAYGGPGQPGMAPYLLTGLMASNVHQGSGSPWAGDGGSSGPASTTFIDTSGGGGGGGGAGGGVTGGSGGF